MQISLGLAGNPTLDPVGRQCCRSSAGQRDPMLAMDYRVPSRVRLPRCRGRKSFGRGMARPCVGGRRISLRLRVCNVAEWASSTDPRIRRNFPDPMLTTRPGLWSWDDASRPGLVCCLAEIGATVNSQRGGKGRLARRSLASGPAPYAPCEARTRSRQRLRWRRCAPIRRPASHPWLPGRSIRPVGRLADCRADTSFERTPLFESILPNRPAIISVHYHELDLRFLRQRSFPTYKSSSQWPLPVIGTRRKCRLMAGMVPGSI